MLHQSVRLQALDIVVDDEALALALQPHIADVNRQRFVPTIARVLEEFDVPDEQIRIARIDVDLGDLPVADFEQAADTALHHAFRQAVEEAVRRARETPSEDEHVRPDAASRFDLFEHYLVRGTLPSWASADDVSLDGLLSHLAQNEPDRLVAVLVRLARQRHVLERLALQLDGAGLERLLRLLTPEHAALILAYLFDLRQTHRVAALVAVGEDDFARALWVFVLTYLLRDPGSQFNRKSFASSLIAEIAEREGIDERELLRSLQRGLSATRRRQSLASSLPAIVAELMDDRSIAAEDGPPADDIARPRDDMPAAAASRLDLLARSLVEDGDATSGVGMSMEQLVHRLLVEDPDGLKTLLFRHDRPQQVVRRLVERLGDPVLQRILALIDAQHAVLIVAYLVALRDVHRRDVLLKWSDERFARLLWFLVLTYVLRDPGTPFNRKSFVRSLLTGIADREIVGYVDLLVILQRGLRHTKLDPSAASLLGVIGDLADEIDPQADEGVAAVSETSEDDPLAWLSHYLATGRIPSADARNPGDLFHRAVLSDAAGTAFLLWKLARSASTRAALFDCLSSHIRLEEVASLFEAAARPVDIADLAGGDGDAASLDRSPDARQAWSALLEAIGTGTVRVSDRATAGHSADVEQSIDPDIELYDIVEISRVVLRHGVLPWRVLLQDPDATVEHVLAKLSELPPAYLRRAFDGAADERLRLAERLMQHLPEHRIHAMLARLIALASSGDPFRSALASFARDAESRPAFHARALLALLDRTPLDLEQAAAAVATIDTSAAVRPSDPSQWDIAVLKSELIAKLEPGAVPGGAYPSGQILQALADRDIGEASCFLRVVTERPDVLHSLVREIASELLQSILMTLYPAEAAAARACLDALAKMVPHPLSADRRHALAVELVFDLLRRTPEVAFLQALRRAGVASLPDGARRISAALPDEYSAAYEAAWTRLAGDDGDTRSEAEVASVPSPRLRDAAIDWLQGAVGQGVGTTHPTAALAPLSRDLLADTIERLIAADPASVATVIRRSAGDAEHRGRWARSLPEPTLLRLVSVIAPGRHYWALPIIETLVAAWRDVAPSGQRPVADRALFWTFLLEMMSEHDDRLTPDRFVAAFVARTAARDQTLAARLFERAGALARNAGHAWLLPILARGRSVPGADGASVTDKAAAPATRTKPKPGRGKTAFALGSDEDDGGTPIYIDNAGLILTAPFLPHLFQTLDLLHRDDGGRQRLRDRDCISRAAHLLQYLVDARTDTPEPRLVLNKILAGVPPQAPVARAIDMGEPERTLCDQLLRAMIANWPIIAQTSIAGLRETFLRREGKLQRTDDGWKLRVQRKTVDVLVDQVPWNHTIVFQSWMPQPLHVTW